MEKKSKEIPFKAALIPVIFFILFNIITLVILKHEGIHIPLICSAAVAVTIAALYRFSWEKILEGITTAISQSMEIILVIIMLGIMVSLWIQGGVIPSMIYYGFMIISPRFFLVFCFLGCSLIAYLTRSFPATIGIGGFFMLIFGEIWQIPAPLAAGAVVSGAFLGDRLLILLNPSSVDQEKTNGRRSFTFAIIPPFIISIILFGGLGMPYHQHSAISDNFDSVFSTRLPHRLDYSISFPDETADPLITFRAINFDIPRLDWDFSDGRIITNGDATQTITYHRDGVYRVTVTGRGIPHQKVQATVTVDRKHETPVIYLKQRLFVHPLLLLALLLVVGMIMLRVPVLFTLMSGAIIGAVFALLFQGSGLKGIVNTAYEGFKANTALSGLNKLLSRGGLSSTTDAIALLFCSLAFAGVMQKCGMFKSIFKPLLKRTKKTGSILTSAVFASLFLNIFASSPESARSNTLEWYKDKGARGGAHPDHLSRMVNNTAVATAPLWIWNTSGALVWAILGIKSFALLPYAFLNLLIPVFSIFYACTGLSLQRKSST